MTPQTRTAPHSPDLTNPDDPAVTEALTRTCDICKAKIGHLCTNSIRPNVPLPGRIVHIGRTEAR